MTERGAFPSQGGASIHRTAIWKRCDGIRQCLVFGVAAILVCSCSDGSGSAPLQAPTEPADWSFQADFEGASSLGALFPSDLQGWTNVQCVGGDGRQGRNPQGSDLACGANGIALDSGRAASGRVSVRLDADTSGSEVSKAAIAKQGVDFRPGQVLVTRMKIFLAEGGSAKDLFLFDLESTEKPGYPGRRLALSGAQELILESKNAGMAFASGPDFHQPSASRIPLPRGRWVDVSLEIRISRGSDGYAKIWQDGALVMESHGQTFPAEAEITRYDWVEAGITANSSPAHQTLWLDDFRLEKHSEGETP